MVKHSVVDAGVLGMLANSRRRPVFGVTFQDDTPFERAAVLLRTLLGSRCSFQHGLASGACAATSTLQALLRVSWLASERFTRAAESVVASAIAGIADRSPRDCLPLIALFYAFASLHVWRCSLFMVGRRADDNCALCSCGGRFNSVCATVGGFCSCESFIIHDSFGKRHGRLIPAPR